MPTPPAFSNAQKAKRDFGVRLGEIRKAAGFTGRALASSCGWHESKVSRIENGRTSPSATDVQAWAETCAALDQLPDLIASLEAIEGMFVEWRRMERTGLKRAQQAVLPLWERTRRFRTYSPWLIPGAVQTESYTRAVLRGTSARRGLPDDVDAAVTVRKDRLRLLYEGNRTFAVLIEESVLRNVIGGADVMAGQLGHLLTVGELPSVSLGILPMGLDRTGMPPVEDFWIFDDSQVNVELISGYLTITQPGELAMYADAFRRLADLAVVGAGARRLVAAAIEALE
ncbi:transcriptional regulator, XRE family [Kribbella flavida DSM 17836]|uniref:Transcriptional regulator, XRE family n=1 Tax=Kribbella flavida (strain DSM 17836 / JCM 10339 / NBRC 14399) TaxID=479435 RepID=D2PXU2_KRIFD|nr:helix-turn-helix transcriptional regulator [Kribbella flavida]ADB31734.1 transcriptional regulator, XRE family [Kribbella flavida DSM 17836]